MKRSSLAASIAERVIGEGLPLLFLLAWWLTARTMPDFILPGPLQTGETLLQVFIDPAFMGDTLISLARVVVSVILAVLIGGRHVSDPDFLWMRVHDWPFQRLASSFGIGDGGLGCPWEPAARARVPAPVGARRGGPASTDRPHPRP